MWEKIKKITPDTWARTICLLIALVNQCLAIFGKQALPFAENDIYQVVSILATIVTGAVAWWKNNSFTTVAQTADAVMKQMKAGQLDTGSLQPILNGVQAKQPIQEPVKPDVAGTQTIDMPAAESTGTVDPSQEEGPAESVAIDEEEQPGISDASGADAEVTRSDADSSEA